MLASGMSQQQILDDFPELLASDIQSVPAYAASLGHIKVTTQASQYENNRDAFGATLLPTNDTVPSC
jgi:hypothetical protein